MAAILYLLLFLSCGVLIIRSLFPRRNPLVRLWLGASLGVLLLMVLPRFAPICSTSRCAHMPRRACCCSR